MRFLRFALIFVVGSLVFAGPASADPAVPTNFMSKVVESSPVLPDGFDVRVVGGDSFLELTVPEGHTAEVPDYGSEGTYLRFKADGTVERNENSAAAAASNSRYGSGGSRDTGGAVWVKVASDGIYAWHDHRIHWMLRTPPPTGPDGKVDLGGTNGDWTVDLLIDGTKTVTSGELRLLDAPSPLPWFAAVALACAAVVAGWWWNARRGNDSGFVTEAITFVVSTSVFVVAAAERAFTPSGTAGWPVGVILGVIAALVSGALLIAGPKTASLTPRAAVASLLIGWSAFRVDVWSNAVLPTAMPYWLDRSVTAAALGLGVGLALILVLPRPKTVVPADRTEHAPA